MNLDNLAVIHVEAGRMVSGAVRLDIDEPAVNNFMQPWRQAACGPAKEKATIMPSRKWASARAAASR